MPRRPNPFAIKESGGDIGDRDVAGFSFRAYEGTSLGEPGLGSLRRVISQRVPQVLAFIVGVVFLLLGTRIAYLQMVRGQYWRSIAEGNRIRLVVVPAQRGELVDRHNQPLAWNTPSFRLLAIPQDLPRAETERQELLNRILAPVPTELLDQENLMKLGPALNLPVSLASHLPLELALQLMALTANEPGFKVEVTAERTYAEGYAWGHVLGYIGPVSSRDLAQSRGQYQLTDVTGKAGLELEYEQLLRGTPGKREVEVDALGHERKVYAALDPVPGAKLKLTLDSRLQAVAYRALERAVKGTGKRGGSVVVLDPRSDEVLAMVSYPSFDPNIFTVARDRAKINELFQNEQKPLYNRAIQAAYPPGSTIKPFYAGAALQEGVITPQTTVLSTGGIQAGNQFFADWKAGGHGVTNVYRAIAESVNTFFYIIGGGTDDRRGLGISRMVSYLARFAFGRNLNIDMPGERPGFIPTPTWKAATMNERWYRGDTYNVAIGQGNLIVTPMQLAVGYAALATDGILRWPHLVRQVAYPSGEVSDVLARPLGIPILDEATLRVLRAAMRQTVTAGSARSLGSLPVAVAGKTGTAQTSPGKATHAWFAGYAPAEAPELVVVAMVEYGGEGSSVAVPIARDIFAWYADVRPSLKNP